MLNLTESQKQNLVRWRRRFRQVPDGLELFSKHMTRIDPTEGQKDMFRGYMKKGRVALRAGHGVGKTTAIAIMMYHQLYCYNQSRVAATAPTQHQVYDILWAEAASLLKQSRPELRLFCQWTKTRINVRGHSQTWFAHGIPSSNPNALSGIHNKHLLYLVDEAPGVPDAAFEVIEGALTREENSIAMIGNPVMTKGYFYRVFQDPAGWFVSKLTSANSPLVSPEYEKRMARRFGKDSNVYRVRVLGEFPITGDDVVLSVDLVAEAMAHEIEGTPSGMRAIGVDVARYGNDRSVIYGRIGGKIVHELVIDRSDLVYLRARIQDAILKLDPDIVNIDASGLGAGVPDEVRNWAREHDIVVQINGIKNNETAKDPARYENVGTEMYFELQESLIGADIPNDADLQFELTEREFVINPRTNRYQIVDKETLRRRLKAKHLEPRSPDKGDALALCFYMPRSSRGSVGAFA